MNTKKETTGQRFRKLRKVMNLTQEKTAESLNISLALYSQIENDHKLPSTTTLIAAADLFAVSVDYLLCRSDSASDTGLSPESLQILTADHADVQKRLADRRDMKGLAIRGYNAEQSDLQSLATVIDFLLRDGRADREGGGLLDLLRVYFCTPDDATMIGLTDGITAAGRRPVHLPTGQVLTGMYYARIQQVLVQYRNECQKKHKRKSLK